MYDFKLKFDEYLNCVNEELERIFCKTEPALEASMRYSIEAGGKRIRPILVLASCESCGGNMRNALAFACAVEIVHTYSLIYDDLPCMDDDVLRRGKPTNHVVFGEAVALLAGMGLYARAFEIIIDSCRDGFITQAQAIEGMRILLEASGTSGIVSGQFYDMENVEGNPSVNEDYLTRVHMLKTSAMLEASVHMGAVAADAGKDEAEALLLYAKRIGLAFQIRDDVLDVVGTEASMGKSIGKDKAEKKFTFADMYGIDGSQEKIETLTQEGKSALKGLSDPRFLSDLADMLCYRTK